MRDIAADLGVSASLVSKVLNGRLGTTGVREDIAQTIRRRAAEMGYRKNQSAASLRSGRQGAIGVFIHRIGMAGSGIAESLLEGISSAARASKIKLLLDFFRTADEFGNLCDEVHLGVMDGLIVGGVMHPELTPALLRIQRSGIPLVTICNEPMHPALPNIGIDNIEVGRIATRHLIERGCRRLAHIRDIPARFQGFRQALEAGGLPCRPEAVYRVPRSVEFSHQAGERAVAGFIESGVPFDGLVTQSDHEAMGAINALYRAGLRAPEDVRVIGVDNAPYCEFGRVPLSSVSQNFDERGRQAVCMVLDVIDGRDVPSAVVAPTLVPRESSR